jgi:AcrR family transcriptional regulator
MNTDSPEGAGKAVTMPLGADCADSGQKMRADARRSRARLLEAATAAFAENGADAPLDDIARRAGVGIGTLYRHFPTRVDLQAAVFRSQVKSVCDTGDELLISVTPEAAFAGWLRAMAGYLATKRGLSGALIAAVGKDSELISSCWVAMRDTADRLLAHAQEAGVLRDDISSQDLLRLVHGIAMATEHAPEDTDRLLSLLLDGLRKQLSPGRARPPDAHGIAGGRFSKGVLSTTVVRVATFAAPRICCSSSSSAAGDATRTVRR